MINGVTHAIKSIPVGTDPSIIAVNTATETIYTGNILSNDVTAINRKTFATKTIPIGAYPSAMAANPLTNRIYVAEPATSSVAVIDGSTKSFSVVPTGYAQEVAIDELRNKIYVLNGGDTITVIDGKTNSTSSISTFGSSANSLALDVLTNEIYVANLSSDNISVLNGTVGLPLPTLDQLILAPNAGK